MSSDQNRHGKRQPQDVSEAHELSTETTLTVGLVPAPELPEILVSLIIEALADQLASEVDDTCQWQLDRVTDPLIGAKDNTRDILSKAQELSESRHWDYIICITDLPIFRHHSWWWPKPVRRGAWPSFHNRPWAPRRCGVDWPNPLCSWSVNSTMAARRPSATDSRHAMTAGAAAF